MSGQSVNVVQVCAERTKTRQSRLRHDTRLVKIEMHVHRAKERRGLDRKLRHN